MHENGFKTETLRHHPPFTETALKPGKISDRKYATLQAGYLTLYCTIKDLE